MLKDEYFVFTGTLTTMTRKQAQSIITGLIGHNRSNVTKKTTRLVTGYFPIDLIKVYYDYLNTGREKDLTFKAEM